MSFKSTLCLVFGTAFKAFSSLYSWTNPDFPSRSLSPLCRWASRSTLGCTQHLPFPSSSSSAYSHHLLPRLSCFSWESNVVMSLSASPAPFLLFFLFLLPLPPCQPESQRSDPSMNPDPRTALPSIFPSSSVLPSLSNDNSTSPSIGDKCDEVTVCKPGILLPVWYPENPGVGYQVARAVVYFLSLMYMFLGVSIIADRFMASIEVITSQVGWQTSFNYL